MYFLLIVEKFVFLIFYNTQRRFVNIKYIVVRFFYVQFVNNYFLLLF